MSILKEIYEYKKNFVEEQKNKCSQKKIENQLKIDKNSSFKFYKKLKKECDQISIIGEIKKGSPSLGKFVDDNINIIQLANIYEKNNISCLSILTDEKYFNGKLSDLEEIRKSTIIPILRKDFIVDEYQIYESKLSGADCILIILSMLKQEDADKFSIIANDLGMDSIVEIHNLDELKRSNNMISNMIGINNRNLNNFETDLNTTIKLSKELQNNEKLFISESGFHRKEDIDIICENTSINNFLIGEYLMKSQNLPSHIRELLN